MTFLRPKDRRKKPPVDTKVKDAERRVAILEKKILILERKA